MVILFNCRYLGRTTNLLRKRGMTGIAHTGKQISPLGWDHVNLTDDDVWSDSSYSDDKGHLPMEIGLEWLEGWTYQPDDCLT